MKRKGKGIRRGREVSLIARRESCCLYLLFVVNCRIFKHDRSIEASAFCT
jgi:hypothetical protein